MPTGLKRYHQTGNFHFVTFSCYRRQPLLASSAAKHTLQHILEQTRAQQNLLVIAYVLMPEHVHLLTDEPERGTLATSVQILKYRSAVALLAEGGKAFWQTRYYDRNVRTQDETIEKINYIHRNPVKRGLVNTPEHYAWSSACHYTTGTPGIVHLHRL